MADRTMVMDDTLCKPDCEVCHGVGYVSRDVPLNDPTFGRIYPCPNAPLTSRVWNDCGLTISEREYSWSEIHGRKDEATNKALHDAVAAVKEILEKRNGFVLLYGGNGLAKTLILKIAVAETIRSRKLVGAKYTTMVEVIDEMRRSFDEERPGASLREMTDKYKKYPVLAIDELGVERKTEFSDERQFVLLDHRYNAAIESGEKLVTLLATNLALDEFPARIRDRMTDGRCFAIKLVGESLRPGLK